ncbi:hypothetical protein COO91_10152 (plasmid) [Nostoc flagelliforme CCNUN1]|uniref:Uncharacterized protein n=1 Tax=Nostoc flagelliforme CCNUN1 TaxID=2038116 RepID=A0A2K8T8B9_9NOSO|nr:hypothetical protein [Nostoc flagelliforme]AUB43938.1 hypothetical protein COO91_10152 [Nostoc flagelliforme CCNUN1]
MFGVKRRSHSFPDSSDRLLICVLIDVVASHNTLNLELAKPHIYGS